MNLELIQEKWDDILQSFKEEHSISDISFKSWLLPLEPTSIEDDTLIVVFDPKDDQESDPDQMAINYITKKYAKFLVSWTVMRRPGRFVPSNEGISHICQL